ncbi:hypothetical protein CPJCM30710_05950 [Clostridium polyendosporum]|uniref:Uncharacterized protein n=1 Tax=Clostridium polyendosporum TaxID=69208 RepID=A0A919VDF1_9CLOT|nr:hypothetical protein [Clostridium polyendosporum]GIM27929.1 hypothetical protein CPJCM30710_05950 [Clostridium polyendosporum]
MFHKSYKTYNNYEMEQIELLDGGEKLLKKANFRILKIVASYDSEEDQYITLATCINQNNEIETISIEGFKIENSVTSLQGAYIEIDVYQDDNEEYYEGRIYKQ